MPSALYCRRLRKFPYVCSGRIAASAHGHEDRPGRDEERPDPRLPGKLLPEEYEGEDEHENDAQAVESGKGGGRAGAERQKIEKPRQGSGNARERDERKHAMADAGEERRLAERKRSDHEQERHEHGADGRRQRRVNIRDADLAEHRCRERRREQPVENPRHVRSALRKRYPFWSRSSCTSVRTRTAASVLLPTISTRAQRTRRCREQASVREPMVHWLSVVNTSSTFWDEPSGAS